MTISSSLLEVHQYTGEGYLPLIDYGAWRVAVLRYCDELLPHNLTSMQRHDETDEVFVLLSGKCILFLGSGKDQVERVEAADMLPLKIYNVKRHAWHTHTLSPDATVLIVENCDTTNANSPHVDMSVEQQLHVVDMVKKLWG